MNIQFTIPIPPITKKNSQQMLKNRRTGKIFPAPSKAFLKYQEDAGWYIPSKGLEINTRVNVKAVFYTKTEGIVDLVGLLQALNDILVHYKVVADDNRRIIFSHDGSRAYVDSKNPRTEVTITLYEL